MICLWDRLDAAHEAEPIPGPHLNNALTRAALDWFEDRLVQDDVLDAMREVLPATDDVLLALIGAIGRAVRQP